MESKTHELETYCPPLTRQRDFDSFWQESLQQAKEQPLREVWKEIEYPLKTVRVFDIQYCGFDETPIHGYFVLPAWAKPNQKLPCVIHFHGYGGGRRYPHQLLPWVMLDTAVLSIDCREQGGITGNHVLTPGAIIGNISTKGLLDERQYYYRAVYMDCVKAIDFVLTCQQVNASRIILQGASQGGGLAIAAAALDYRPMAVVAHVPSQSDLERRVRGCHGSFASVHDFLRCYPQCLDRVLKTLSYFDTMNMAERIQCQVYASVALEDTICPAECFYASYNRIISLKQIRVYPFNDHENAGALQTEEELRWLRTILDNKKGA